MRKLLALLTAFLLLAGPLFAQKTITGKVTDDKGNPIPNASVIIKGKSAFFQYAMADDFQLSLFPK